MSRSISRWTPSGDPVRERLSRLVDQAFGDFLGSGEEGEAMSSRVWSPAVDVLETDDSLVLRAELPGLKREDVQITLESNTLTLKGERRFERKEDESFLRIETTYGAFSRSFTLPSNIRGDETRASFQDGILEIRIPKAEEARPRHIEIA